MSMISNLADRLRAESKSMGKYGVDYMATLLMQASDTIIMLSEKARADRLQGEWIPCSERLPQIGQKVLVSTKKTVFTQVFKGYHSDPKRWAWENNSVKRVEAWQPLPQPWKGADDE